MRLERTQDAELIKAIVTHDSIWPHVSEDGVPRETWAPLIHETIYQLLIVDGDKIVGMFILAPFTSTTWEVHTCTLPECRGDKARDATKLCAEWMFENTPCLHIITKVPAYNKPAYKLAIDTGLRNIGVIESAWMRNGEAQDLYILGVRKCPQHQQ